VVNCGSSCASALVRAFAWNQAVLLFSYEALSQRILLRATGVGEEVQRRLIKVYAGELTGEINRELEARRPV